MAAAGDRQRGTSLTATGAISMTLDMATLRHFRQELYDDLGLRQDSLFELVDAVLDGAPAQHAGAAQLDDRVPSAWPSTCDALADGSIDVSALRKLFARDAGGLGRGRWPSSVGDRRDQLATPSGARQRRPHLGVSAAAGLAAKRHRARLGVSMVGGGAGRGWQLGAAAGCAAPRTDGEVGDAGRTRPDRRGRAKPKTRMHHARW